MTTESAWLGPLPRERDRAWEEIVERARAGDRQAFGDLVERLWVELVALARAVLASDLQAEDLVQETLVNSWRRLAELRDPGRFGAWVRRSLVRRCIRQLRSDRRRIEAFSAGPTATAPPDHAGRVTAERALAVLSPRQRVVIYLTAVEGRTDREIASILGLFPPTVRVHRLRALRRLRAILGEP